MQNNRQWSETSNYVQLQWGIIVLIIAYLCFGSQWILLLTRSFTPITALNNETSMYLTPEELVKKAGCIYEKHIVQTEDGYLLQVDRIRRGCNAPIVLFLHGIFASSTSFIILGRNNSLAFTLFDEGYDVWLGNFRGNMFSREHVTLDPSEEEFWNFGWHESGIYDLPAMLSYITSFCKKEVDALINHSMGGTVFFVMASQRPEALRMIRNVYSMSPVTYVEHSIGFLASASTWVQTFYTRTQEVFARPQLFVQFVHSACLTNLIEHEICTDIVRVSFGPSGDNFNRLILSKVLPQYPLGGSGGQLIHYAQLIMSPNFRMYDFGVEKNLQVYGSTLPPEYDISNYTIPTVIFGGTNDYLVNVKDLDKLAKVLSNVTVYICENYNHIDFIIGENSFKKKFNYILQFMRKNRLAKQQDQDGQCHD